MIWWLLETLESADYHERGAVDHHMCFTRTCVPHNRTHRSRRRSFAVWLHSRSLKHAARQLLL